MNSPNKALDPTAVSASSFTFTGFVVFLSFLNPAVPAVGQLGRSAKESLRSMRSLRLSRPPLAAEIAETAENGRGEWDRVRTDFCTGLPDEFAEADHLGSDFREPLMRVEEDRKPNQSLQATPVGAGLEALSRRPGVPELGR